MKFGKAGGQQGGKMFPCFKVSNPKGHPALHIQDKRKPVLALAPTFAGNTIYNIYTAAFVTYRCILGIQMAPLPLLVAAKPSNSSRGELSSFFFLIKVQNM